MGSKNRIVPAGGGGGGNNRRECDRSIIHTSALHHCSLCVMCLLICIGASDEELSRPEQEAQGCV